MIQEPGQGPEGPEGDPPGAVGPSPALLGLYGLVLAWALLAWLLPG